MYFFHFSRICCFLTHLAHRGINEKNLINIFIPSLVSFILSRISFTPSLISFIPSPIRLATRTIPYYCSFILSIRFRINSTFSVGQIFNFNFLDIFILSKFISRANLAKIQLLNLSYQFNITNFLKLSFLRIDNDRRSVENFLFSSYRTFFSSQHHIQS